MFSVYEVLLNFAMCIYMICRAQRSVGKCGSLWLRMWVVSSLVKFHGVICLLSLLLTLCYFGHLGEERLPRLSCWWGSRSFIINGLSFIYPFYYIFECYHDDFFRMRMRIMIIPWRNKRMILMMLRTKKLRKQMMTINNNNKVAQVKK